MTSPRLTLYSAGDPHEFRCLQDEFQQRKRRFLRMLACEHLDPEHYAKFVPAMRRKYLLDRSPFGGEASEGWERLRDKPSDEWRNRITDAVRDARQARADKKATVWTDDPVTRASGLDAAGEESVNHVTARLAIKPIQDAAWLDGADEILDDAVACAIDTFPPPIFLSLPRPDGRLSAKELVRAISEMLVVQLATGPTQGKTIRDVLLGRASTINVDADDALKLASRLEPAIVNPLTGEEYSAGDLVAEIKPRLAGWLDSLTEPVVLGNPGELGDFVARWLGKFPGIDPPALADAFGLEHARVLLEARRLYPKTIDIAVIVDLLAFIAGLAKAPVNQAIPSLSDLVAFGSRPVWTGVQWVLEPSDPSCGAPPPATPQMLLDGDDYLYRSLVAQPCAPDATGTGFFRMDPAPSVPAGWTWPANDPNFIYWWRSVLRRHCAEHLMILKDTADFHVTDLLRFVHLFGLYGDTPDTRVPRYVADCVKASLLHFKYWFDEPPATGNKGAEMTFWSENHQIQFHASQFLVGQLFPEDVFPRSGMTEDGRPMQGSDHEAQGRERLERWLDRRLAFGFSEWCSPGYYNEDFPPVLNVVDFSHNERLATKAAMVVDLLIFDLARNTCRGSFAVTAGRAYFEHKCYGWEQSVGETIEVLFGTRGDHLRGENTAVALCTSPAYTVPDALLAIGRDRTIIDGADPLVFRARVSLDPEEGRSQGIGFENEDDAAFWWGLGAYFDAATIELTREVAARHDNLSQTTPLELLFKLDLIGGYLKALLIDTAEAMAGGTLAAGTSLLLLAPFPLNLVAGAVHVTSVVMLIEGLINLLEDLAKMIANLAEAAWDWITGQDPPKPDIPQPALQRAWEAVMATFNGGNVLGRANLYTYSVGDAMLSSVQNHRARTISFQKQPWIASLGCDACVWTNAPMDPGGSWPAAGWEVFKHLALVQAGRALGDVTQLAQVGLDDIRDEGLRDWGGSICLPKVAQHRGVTIAAYDFPAQRSEFSSTFTHAWFPADFFDEVSPAPQDDAWLPERAAGGTWVFGRKGDGYVALFSARRIRWLRDERFKDDPDPASTDGTMGMGRFVSTELRADDGSNVWVCAIGNRTQFGSFGSFIARISGAYLHWSGVGELGQLQCTFDMPAADGTGEAGFRWELFFDDDEAHLDGATVSLDAYPRFEGRYVSGRSPGRVDWRETAYRVIHPVTGLTLTHDVARVERELAMQAQPCRNLPLATRVGGATARAAVSLPGRVSTTEPASLRSGSAPWPSGSVPGRRHRFRIGQQD